MYTMVHMYAMVACSIIYYLFCLIHYIVATVYFNQSIYTVNENDMVIQPVLVLNTMIFIDVTVLIVANENTAIGE